jgi:lysozyme family protein
MTEKAKKIINNTLKNEGYYSNVEGDTGGETYRGISRVYHPRWSGWTIVDKYKPLKKNQKIDDETLDNLILDFYESTFYQKVKADSIDSMLISAHLYDQAVNSGNVKAIKLLQQAIKKVTGLNIAIDGAIGPITINNANGKDREAIEQEFINQRNENYKAIVAKNPSQKKFLAGWLNRVKDTTKAFS